MYRPDLVALRDMWTTNQVQHVSQTIIYVTIKNTIPTIIICIKSSIYSFRCWQSWDLILNNWSKENTRWKITTPLYCCFCVKGTSTYNMLFPSSNTIQFPSIVGQVLKMYVCPCNKFNISLFNRDICNSFKYITVQRWLQFQTVFFSILCLFLHTIILYIYANPIFFTSHTIITMMWYYWLCLYRLIGTSLQILHSLYIYNKLVLETILRQRP